MVSKKFVCVHENCLSFHHIFNLFLLEYQKIICSMFLYKRIVISFVAKMHKLSSFDGKLMNLVILVLLFWIKCSCKICSEWEARTIVPTQRVLFILLLLFTGLGARTIVPPRGEQWIIECKQWVFVLPTGGREGWMDRVEVGRVGGCFGNNF